MMGRKSRGKKLRRQAMLPPMGDTVENVAGKSFHPIEEIQVVEYHPLPDGQGRPTQVHLLLKVKGLDVPLTFRIKSREAADLLIGAIERHADNVWGDPNP